jgi:hypothetical protein
MFIEELVGYRIFKSRSGGWRGLVKLRGNAHSHIFDIGAAEHLSFMDLIYIKNYVYDRAIFGNLLKIPSLVASNFTHGSYNYSILCSTRLYKSQKMVHYSNRLAGCFCLAIAQSRYLNWLWPQSRLVWQRQGPCSVPVAINYSTTNVGEGMLGNIHIFL